MSKTAYIVISIFFVIILVYIANKQGYINIPFLNKKDDKSDLDAYKETGALPKPKPYLNPSIPKFPYLPLPIKSSNTQANLAVAVVQLMANKYGAKLDVDGKFGPNTKAALKKLLAANGLSYGNGNITSTTIGKIETSLGVSPTGTWEQRVSKL